MKIDVFNEGEQFLVPATTTHREISVQQTAINGMRSSSVEKPSTVYNPALDSQEVHQPTSGATIEETVKSTNTVEPVVESTQSESVLSSAAEDKEEPIVVAPIANEEFSNLIDPTTLLEKKEEPVVTDKPAEQAVEMASEQSIVPEDSNSSTVEGSNNIVQFPTSNSETTEENQSALDSLLRAREAHQVTGAILDQEIAKLTDSSEYKKVA